MGFPQAVAAAFRNYFNFSGRSARPEYWWFALFMFITNIGASILDLMFFIPPDGQIGDLGPVQVVYFLATIVPSISVSVRRLHDIGRTGWWLLLGLIPLIGLIILIVWACQRGEPQPNTYGPPVG